MLQFLFNPHQDPEALRNLQFDVGLLKRDNYCNPNRELANWLVQLPIVVDPNYKDQPSQAQITWLYASILNDIEESQRAKWSLQDRTMDEFDNAQAANAQLNGADDADDAELFGSDSGSVDSLNEDVGSGHGDRRESAKDDINDNKDPVHTREENVIDVTIGNHAIPKPSDGEVSSLTP